MPCLDKVGDAHPKIERIAMTHDPPPVPGSESQIPLDPWRSDFDGLTPPSSCCGPRIWYRGPVRWGSIHLQIRHRFEVLSQETAGQPVKITVSRIRPKTPGV